MLATVRPEYYDKLRNTNQSFFKEGTEEEELPLPKSARGGKRHPLNRKNSQIQEADEATPIPKKQKLTNVQSKNAIETVPLA